LYHARLPFKIKAGEIMANVSEQLAARIKELRQRAGLTQEALALKAYMHVSFLSEIERGLKKPSIESLDKLLTALGMSFQEFFNFEIEVSELRESPALNKLTVELKNRSEREIELIYEIAKSILAFEDKQEA
jgi:transcriptional regulator with XRE-family HTH domain